MTRGKTLFGLFASVCCLVVLSVQAQSPAGRTDRDQLPRPVYRVAQQTPPPSTGGPIATQAALPPAQPLAQPAAQPPHPLEPALQLALRGQEKMKEIHDYSCTVVKHERINGKLNEQQFLFVKVRHEPFSAYTFVLAPAGDKGQEAIYFPSQNDGKVVAHGVGLQKLVGKIVVDPTNALVMKNQKYPIDQIGVANLTRRLIDVAKNDMKYGECDVKFFPSKINGRKCTCIQVEHPVRRPHFTFNLARVFVDDELMIPIRYESYDWPSAPGAKPELIEEYTYVNVKINNNFTNADFDYRNPAYAFQ